MKTVIRLVTEDPTLKDKKGDPKWVYNDYNDSTTITVNGLTKKVSEVEIDDTIDAGKVIKVIPFEYSDEENPAVAA